MIDCYTTSSTFFLHQGIEHHDVLLAHLQQLIISIFQLHFIRRSFKLLFSFCYSRNQCMFPVFGLGFVCCGRLRHFCFDFFLSHVAWSETVNRFGHFRASARQKTLIALLFTGEAIYCLIKVSLVQATHFICGLFSSTVY